VGGKPRSLVPEMVTLVTGGAGFVGANVARRLLDHGEFVVLLHRSAVDPAVVRYVGGPSPRLAFVESDVADRDGLGQALLGHSIDRIVHAAAVTANSPQLETAHFLSTVEVNVLSTLHVMELARSLGVRRILHISSATVYGYSASPGSLSETDATQPVGLYGITKLAAEMLALRFAELHGIDLMVARVSAPYGPLERPTGSRSNMSVPYKVVKAALRSEEILVGSGPTLRDWTYVGDTARALHFLLSSEGLRYRVYNVACGQSHTLEDLLRAVQSALPGTRWRVTEASNRDTTIGAETSVARAPLDVSRLLDEGFSLRYNLEDGVKAYVDWCLSNAATSPSAMVQPK